MNERAATVNGESRLVRFSACAKYRYTLEIQWDWALPYVQFIGLNPSTADEMQDDPTLRRVKGFAKAWGYGGVMMTNLFAWRDTDRRVLKKVPYPIAPKDWNLAAEGADMIGDTGLHNANDYWLYKTKRVCALTIAAWGKDGKILYRGAKVKQLISNMKCLRLLSDGQPEHPLYLPASLTPIPLP